MPVAAQAIQTAMIPQVIQTSAGQQIVMQQVHIAQPQIAQPQYAQILMPNGQVQQVPVVQPQQMLGGLGGIQIQQPQQIAIQAGSSTGTLTSSTASSSTSSTTAVVASPIASTSSTSAMINPKVEPVEIKSEIMDEKQSQQTAQQVQQIQQQQQPQQQQQQQFITMNLNGQQIMVQQPVNQAANTAGAVQQVLRTANGQVIQVANLPGIIIHDTGIQI